MHTAPIPAIGGLAMFVGFIVALRRRPPARPLRPAVRPQLRAARRHRWRRSIIVAVGLFDDIQGSSPPAKVTAIVLAGLVLVQFGVTMYYFRVPFLDDILLSDDWIPLVTVLWLLGMTQAINLIDGLDGLAAGIVAIAAGAFFLYAQKLSDLDLLASPNIGPLVAIIAVGVCVGFLPHNFNPARIIMGDSGALLLGLLMAVSTSVVGGRADPSGQGFVGQTYFFLAPLVHPAAHPRRADPRPRLRRRPPGEPPPGARRRRQGPPPPPPDEPRPRPPAQRADPVGVDRAALGFVLYPVLTDENPSYLPFGMAAIAIVLYTVLHPSVRRRRRDNGHEYDVRATEPRALAPSMTIRVACACIHKLPRPDVNHHQRR